MSALMVVDILVDLDVDLEVWKYFCMNWVGFVVPVKSKWGLSLILGDIAIWMGLIWGICRNL